MRSRLATTTIAAMFSLASAGTGEAHVHQEKNDPISAELMKHWDWIMQARTATGSDCCHEKDVLAGLEEDFVDGHYVVTLPAGMKIYLKTDDESDFFILPQERKIVIRPEAVLDPQTANQVCAVEKTPTCTPPRNLNVLFINPYSLRGVSVTTYCYLPLPQSTNLGAKTQRAMAAFVVPRLVKNAPGLNF